jgi:hypothetical protein
VVSAIRSQIQGAFLAAHGRTTPEIRAITVAARSVRARWLLTVFHVRLPVLPSNLGIFFEFRMITKELSQAQVFSRLRLRCPEVGFEEISSDLLEARFGDSFRVADDPGAIGKPCAVTQELLETDAVWALRTLHHRG